LNEKLGKVAKQLGKFGEQPGKLGKQLGKPGEHRVVSGSNFSYPTRQGLDPTDAVIKVRLKIHDAESHERFLWRICDVKFYTHRQVTTL
jgi:hypothetical protein